MKVIADLRDANIKPLACIVGRAHQHDPRHRAQGVYRYKCCVRGAFLLTPHSVNAIEMAARVVGRVRDMAEAPRFEGFDVPFSTSSVGRFGGIADNVVPRDASSATSSATYPRPAPRRCSQKWWPTPNRWSPP